MKAFVFKCSFNYFGIIFKNEGVLADL